MGVVCPCVYRSRVCYGFFLILRSMGFGNDVFCRKDFLKFLSWLLEEREMYLNMSCLEIGFLTLLRFQKRRVVLLPFLLF